MSVDNDRGLPEEDQGLPEQSPGLSEEDSDLSEEERQLLGQSRIYHLLLVSLLLLMALQPFADIAEGILVQLGLAGLLLAGLAAVASKRRLFLIGLVAGLPAVALFFSSGRIPTVAGGFLTMAMLVFVCLVILRRMFKHPVVTSGTVSAALVVYLIFGVIWAKAYWLVEHFYPGSFTGLDPRG